MERRTRMGGTADQNGWNGGPRGWNGGPRGWDGGQAGLERSTKRAIPADRRVAVLPVRPVPWGALDEKLVCGLFLSLRTFSRRSETINLSRDQPLLARSWESTTGATEWRSPLGCARFRSVGVACHKVLVASLFGFFVIILRRNAVPTVRDLPVAH